MALAGAALGLAGAGAWRAASPPQHVAVATLQVGGAGASDPSVSEGHLRLATSPAVLGRVVAEQNLAGDQEFMPAALGSLDGVLALVGLGHQPGEARRSAAVRGLLDRVSVAREPASDLISVAVRAPSAETAARLANAIAATSIVQRAEVRDEAVRKAASRDAARVASLQTALYEAETRLIEARQSIAPGVDPKLDLQAAKARTSEARQRLEQAQRVGSTNRDSDGEGLRSPILERLQARAAEAARVESSHRQTLGPRHPLMAEAQQQLRDARKAVADEIRRMTDAAKTELAQAEAAEAEAARRAAAAQASPDRSVAKLRALEAEVEANRAAYEQALRARTITDEHEPAPVRLLSAASPAAATPSPGLAATLAAGAAIGGLLGGLTGLLGLRHREENTPAREKTTSVARREPVLTEAPEQESAELARSDVSIVPEAAAEPPSPATAAPDDGAPGFAEVAERPGTPYAEAIAALAEAVLGEAEGAETYTVLVTSLARRSGASTLAANLARVAARGGRRVLLVDANKANPTLSLTFGLGRDPGLLRIGHRERPVHALDGDWSQGLFFLPVDTAGQGDAPQLPDSAVLRFPSVAHAFDLVVIDGPQAGTEPTDAALAATADRILLVSPPGVEADPVWASALLAVPLDKLRELPMAA